MATNVSVLSKDERMLIVQSLDFKALSIVRAAKAEGDPEVREMRERFLGRLRALSSKVSSGELSL